MPFDGIVVKSISKQLAETILGGRVEKVFQPEPDEVILNIRAKGQNLKLIISASANYPRVYFTSSSKENPAAPPVFCMLLRKHLSGGKIADIEFHDFERIISIHVESIDEFGDLTTKRLVVEIMGRHSNIILVNSENRILDSIKHVDSDISSVREVMPAREYRLPPAQDKINPETLDIEKFVTDMNTSSEKNLESYLLSNLKGFSPLLCREICYLTDIDGKAPLDTIALDKAVSLKTHLTDIISQIKSCTFNPCIIYSEATLTNPIDFHCLNILQYPYVKYFNSISEVLDTFYFEKDKAERLKQKKSDVLKALNNSRDRCNKKLSLQQEKLRDVSDRDKLKLYGELITANIYCIPKNVKNVSLNNYYSENNEIVTIPMDINLSAQENAQRYFKQYSKAKSAFSYTSIQLEENQKELAYLESVMHTLENCSTLLEIDEVRQELVEQGYIKSIKKKTSGKKQNKASLPLHFISSDGLDIYVGKNNKQNDSLTLKMSSSNDIWLHTKNIPGSHVIIRKTQQNIPDSTLLEAGILAAYHSKAKMSSSVQVDYTVIKNVKKPVGAKPGMVIYENYKTIIVTPDENIIKSFKTGN